MKRATQLQKLYRLEKPTLPKGRLSRWEAFRFSFDYKEQPNIAARNAIWEMGYCSTEASPRTKWVKEYRHQRVLITGGYTQ